MKKRNFNFKLDKWADLLIFYLNQKRPLPQNQITHRIDVTYSHASNLTFEFEKRGWVKYTRKDRSKYAELTNKGRIVAIKCAELLEHLK